MSFKRERSNRSDQSKSDSSRYSKASWFSYGKESKTRSQSAVPSFRDQAHAEAHYGQEIESAKELHQLQRLEKRYGDRLHGWLAEGMPKKAMGHPQEMADHRIQRAVEGTGTSREDIPETVLEVVGDEGQPLPDTIQRSLEDRMDADFSDVRIQRGPKAAEACDAIGARAFTCGNKIAFNTGEYDTRSPEGQHLLAHELTHVKQQTGGAAISMMPQEGVELEIDPDPQLEREADEAAKQALSGEVPLVVNRQGVDVHIQRADKTRRELLAGDLTTAELAAGIEAANTLSVDPVQFRDAYKFAEYTVTFGGTQAVVQPLVTEFGLSRPEAMAVALAVGGTIHVGKDRLHREEIYLTLEIARLLGAEEKVHAALERMGLGPSGEGDRPESVPSSNEVKE